MPIIEKHWENLNDEKWDRLARAWLRCIRESIETPECSKWWEIVVNLGLWGAPEFIWAFVKRTLDIAETDGELGSIAAGPIEYLLGRSGDEYIEIVETECLKNSKLRRSLGMCNQYRMSDDVWSRVQKLVLEVG